MTFSSPLQSGLLHLRAFELDDLPTLHTYLNHPQLTGRRYLPWTFSDVLPLSTKDIQRLIEKWQTAEKQANLAIVEQQHGELIGHAHLSWSWDPHCPEVSLVIAPEHQCKGYGGETLGLLLDYLFNQTPAHNVGGMIADWNAPARTFAAQFGFQEVGAMRRAGLRNGSYFDLIQVDLLRTEWLTARKGASHGA
jgi:RimJ/RimL family protein N-acetyltransferase